MIEIILEAEGLKISHDNEIYDIDSIISHIDMNGHLRESVGFCLPWNWYKPAGEIAKRIDEVSERRKSPLRYRV